MTDLYVRDLSKTQDLILKQWISKNNDDLIEYSVLRRQAYLNNVLMQKGRLFICEVWKLFKLDYRPIDRCVGWIKNSEEGDEFIDLGYSIKQNDDGSKMYSLNPNVDGFIL